MGSSNSYECKPEEILNVTLSEYVPYFLYDDTERIIVTIINPIILAIGLWGNLAFLFVMFRIPRMKTITNLYLSNLAVADIMFLCIAIFEKIGRYIVSPISGDQSMLGRAGCITIYPIMNASYYASLYLITMGTVEKYYAICRPVQHRVFGSRGRSIKLIVVGWIGAYCFAAALIPAFFYIYHVCVAWPKDGDYSHLPNEYAFCMGVGDWAIPYFNGIQAIPFIITLVLNVILYFEILKAVRHHTRVEPNSVSRSVNTNPNSSSNQSNRQLQRTRIRNQVTKMLVINGVIFFVCLTPLQISSFVSMITTSIEKYVLSDDQYLTLLHVCRILTYINSAVNPYVYAVTNARYRQSFKEAFCCCFLSRNRRRGNINNETIMEDTNTAATSVK